MAIEYGMGSISPDNRGAWVDCFKQLTEQEQQFFHNNLPPLLMAAGVKHISPETIHHILARLDLLDAGRSSTNRHDLETLHVLSTNGVEAAEKFVLARKAAQDLITASLPLGFKPDAGKALERFIGTTSNIATETSTEFLSSLTRKWFNAFPKLTAAQTLREDKGFRAFTKDVGAGVTPHPVLHGEVATA
jgi:hypothetical protein